MGQGTEDISVMTNSVMPSYHTEAIGFNEIGRREENQDYMFPEPLSDFQPTHHSFYMVCDGVGGEAMGHQASKLTCESFQAFSIEHGIHSSEDIRTAIRYAEQRISDFISLNPSAEGMATTLTFITLSDSCALLAHAGDSRIYHVRNGEIQYQTLDHSLVQGLVDQNIITQEEAFIHPHRNVISKAVMGTHMPVEPEIHRIDDVREGDYFFLCSDGVLESINSASLVEIVKKNEGNAKMLMRDIYSRCFQHTKDNYSAWLVSILPGRDTENKQAELSNAKKIDKDNLARWTTWLVVFLILIEIILLLHTCSR